MDKNICLIGYMGSGKTTVGRMLAERLDMDFEDTDELIVKNEGRSIPDIFRDEGEAYFRRSKFSRYQFQEESECGPDAGQNQSSLIF